MPTNVAYECRKACDIVRKFFDIYLGISALLTHESVYNVGVSRFAALHGEENYSGQGCKEIWCKEVRRQEGVGEEVRCQEVDGEEVGCEKGNGEEEERCQEGAGKAEVVSKGVG